MKIVPPIAKQLESFNSNEQNQSWSMLFFPLCSVSKINYCSFVPVKHARLHRQAVRKKPQINELPEIQTRCWKSRGIAAGCLSRYFLKTNRCSERLLMCFCLFLSSFRCPLWCVGDRRWALGCCRCAPFWASSFQHSSTILMLRTVSWSKALFYISQLKYFWISLSSVKFKCVIQNFSLIKLIKTENIRIKETFK